MIEYKVGNIVTERADALVNTVNCVGVMGRGVALQFKNAFPDNFKEYERVCRRGEVQPGRLFVTETGQLTSPRYIINFPTKRHWRGKSRIEDIDAGLVDLRRVLTETGIRSIAIPPLGSGLGGLDWSAVRPRIEQALQGFEDLRIVIFEPGGAPNPEQMAKPRRVPQMTPGRAALIGLMDRYLGGLMDPVVTLLEVHKLMYFMKASGEESLSRLAFCEHVYGPYSDNLRHVLQAIEGYYVTGYGDGGDAPGKVLDLVPGALADAEAVLTDYPETKARFERVADLVTGFESPFGLELLSTVHWVIERKAVTTMADVVDAVYKWNSHKRQFSRRQIEIAMEVLQRKGWISRDVALSSPTGA